MRRYWASCSSWDPLKRGSKRVIESADEAPTKRAHGRGFSWMGRVINSAMKFMAAWQTKTIRKACEYESIAAFLVKGSNEGIMEVECLYNHRKHDVSFGNSWIDCWTYRMDSISSAAFGPVIRVLSAFRRTAWRTAPLSETPMTWPVVRNRYVTARRLVGRPAGQITTYHILPVATAMSSFATPAIIAWNSFNIIKKIPNNHSLTIKVVVIRLAIPKPCGTMSNQRCQVLVRSFQKQMEIVAVVAAAAVQIVRKYSFPVLRIILFHRSKLGRGKYIFERRNVPASKHTSCRNGNLKRTFHIAYWIFRVNRYKLCSIPSAEASGGLETY